MKNYLSEDKTDLVTRFLLFCLSLIYFSAFLSLYLQVDILSGDFGVLPARDFIEESSKQFGKSAAWRYPSVFWFLEPSSSNLEYACLAGALISIVLVFGFHRPVFWFLIWFLYLSLSIAAQDFLSFQWDTLLIEAAFYAIFFGKHNENWESKILHGKLRSFIKKLSSFNTIKWLYRILLFRLIFLSGLVKISSGDPSWQNLTALSYHFETQPLPTVFGWLFHQLPDLILNFMTLAALFIELIVPFFIFAGRRGRCFSFLAISILQLMIMLSGNYCFFNFLALALCISLLEQHDLEVLLPERMKRFLDFGIAFHWPKILFLQYYSFLLVITVSLFLFWMNNAGFSSLPKFAQGLVRQAYIYRTISNYGPFAVMTRARNEIIIEGSENGIFWKEYEFHYKPGDPSKIPSWVQPHQPRLDWQMWFAALGTPEKNYWLLSLMLRIFEERPYLEKVFKVIPYPEKAPKYLRASFYSYRFTSFKELLKTGDWWVRKRQRSYIPAISKRDLKRGLSLDDKGS